MATVIKRRPKFWFPEQDQELDFYVENVEGKITFT